MVRLGAELSLFKSADNDNVITFPPMIHFFGKLHSIHVRGSLHPYFVSSLLCPLSSCPNNEIWIRFLVTRKFLLASVNVLSHLFSSTDIIPSTNPFIYENWHKGIHIFRFQSDSLSCSLVFQRNESESNCMISIPFYTLEFRV